jgi:hypothetical protein
MNAILFTVLALSGADAAAAYGPGHGGAGYCDPCAEGQGGHRHDKGGRGGWLGPMPQTCYEPSFGCYPSTRFMHRYPAFHGTYYRAAYNYRNYFDYPWHAGLHEPTSQFSYHVPREAPPAPPPAAANPRTAGPVRSAAAESADTSGYYLELTPNP